MKSAKYFTHGVAICSISLVVLLASCSRSTPTIQSIQPSLLPPVQTLPAPQMKNLMTGARCTTYHTVGPLETVWRIGKMYDVSVEDIIKANNLDAKGDVKAGQKLCIPNAAPMKPVIPLYPSLKWKYIIVHHSATHEGNAFLFNRAHHKRGWLNGLGYHFVIDNGTMGKLDGQIEVSPRWIKQQNGAHCKANNMNYHGIGICLVGDFTNEVPTRRQMASLVYLTNLLKNYYSVPLRNIYGHGMVYGASTECPGKKFPWRSFIQQLN